MSIIHSFSGPRDYISSITIRYLPAWSGPVPCSLQHRIRFLLKIDILVVVILVIRRVGIIIRRVGHCHTQGRHRHTQGWHRHAQGRHRHTQVQVQNCPPRAEYYCSITVSLWLHARFGLPSRPLDLCWEWKIIVFASCFRPQNWGA